MSNAAAAPIQCEPYYLKVNIHYMLHPNPDSVNNFAEFDDGGSAAAWKWDRAGGRAGQQAGTPLPPLPARTDYNGYTWAKALIEGANAD